MLEINHILKELLQLHDCVIFPNLGGFVAQYSPANLDEKKSVLSPPHKQILFNKNLVNNDGLLANAFAQKNNISYEDICILVRKQSESVSIAKHLTANNVPIVSSQSLLVSSSS